MNTDFVSCFLVPFFVLEGAALAVCVLSDHVFDANFVGFLLCPIIAVGACAWGAANAFASDSCAGAGFLGAMHLLVGVPLLDALLGNPTRRMSGSDARVSKAVRVCAVVLAALELALLVWVAVREARRPDDLASLLRTGGLALSLGIVNGAIGVSAAHELFHSRRAPLAHAVAFVLLSMAAYCPFYFPHRHHHLNVATPQDGTTARRGEPYLFFVPRSVFGGLRDAWRREQQRAGAVNRVLVALVVPPLVVVGIIAVALRLAHDFETAAAFRAALSRAAQFYFVQAAVAVLAVELGNYLQHYGLQRNQSRLDAGRFERVQWRHSWDCDLLACNFYLFGVARHSHHHVEPALPLGSLTQQVAPVLPFDYFVFYWFVAWMPFKFFAIMDARIDAFKREQQDAIEDGDVNLANAIDHVGLEAGLDIQEGIL